MIFLSLSIKLKQEDILYIYHNKIFFSIYKHCILRINIQTQFIKAIFYFSYLLDS